MSQLTEHFSLEELTVSESALRAGIDNAPPDEVIANLTHTAHGLELVRDLLGFPIHVNSGYRCPELNTIVGGAKDSAHMFGYAADIICPQFGTPLQICQKIATSNIDFDKVITEGDWTHISFAPGNRKLTMTAHFGPAGTSYTEGLSG